MNVIQQLGKAAGRLQAHSNLVKLHEKRTTEDAKRRMGRRSNSQSPHRYGRRYKG